MMEATMAAKRFPDDVVRDILLRVSTDVAALFRCCLTCKRWCALAAKRSFLRSRWPDSARHPSSVLGFFVQQQRCTDDSRLFQPVFLPSSYGSVLGSHRRSLASFIPGLPCGELDGAVPLTARHGLLLVRLARRASDDPARLAVCNLLAGTCDVLPSLKRGVFSVNCAIVTRADCQPQKGHHQRSPSPPSNYSNFFKVLAIVSDGSPNHYGEWNNLYTFSSEQPGWSEPTNCFEEVGRPDKCDLAILQWRSKVVVCGGMAHWLVLSMSRYYILDVSIETGDISLTDLSIPNKQHCTRRYIGGPTLFVTSTGSLSLFWLQEEGLSLDTWTHADDGSWLHAKTVELKPPKMWNPKSAHVWSGEKSGVLLIIDTFVCVHMVDIESGTMENVSEQFRSSWGMMAVPMEIDWPALFMSRLGGAKH